MKPFEGMRRQKEAGKPVIGCFPLYPPVELFHSMGLAPVILWGLTCSVHDADRHVQSYVCSIARRLAQLVMTENDLFDGIFFYNACDTLRNLPEILREGLNASDKVAPRMFRLHVPMVPTEQTDSSDYLANEIQNLIDALEDAYGMNFSEEKFAQSVLLNRKARALCMRLEDAVSQGKASFSEFCDTLMSANFLPVDEQIELLEAKTAALEVSEASKVDDHRVIVSGILPPPPKVNKLIDEAGLRVVGNDIAAFRRSYAHTPETWTDAYDYYLHFYRDHFPCTTLLYSADRRIEEILKMTEEHKADGFLFIGEKFCEYEYFELPYLEGRLKERGISVLAIEISMEDDATAETYRTRIEAFTEMLAAGKSAAGGVTTKQGV